MLKKHWLIAMVWVGIFAAAGLLAKGPKYTDPNHADADFVFQGEYVGNLTLPQGDTKYGVQIVALGQGAFRAVGYWGGLPGAGWDGSERRAVEGQRKDDSVVFATDQVTVTLRDGTVTITGQDGNQIGRLKKTVRRSPTLGKKPPAGALVLFNGTNTDAWEPGRMTPDGLLMEGATSKEKLQDQTVHLEFRLPYQPEDRGQGRGNSGVYLQGRYEVQMLDSFGLEGKDNECGGIYTIKAPDVNMCFPPLSWQTYDIEFTAARYDARGKCTATPKFTVRHNGVLIHDKVQLPTNRSTRAAPVKPGPEPGPLFLQNHGCPVRYKNIWVLKK